MKQKRYTQSFKIDVAKEALLPENKNCEKRIAAKYELTESCVRRWAEVYSKYGEKGFSRKGKTSFHDQELLEAQRRIDELEEEVEILRKAATLLKKEKP